MSQKPGFWQSQQAGLGHPADVPVKELRMVEWGWGGRSVTVTTLGKRNKDKCLVTPGWLWSDWHEFRSKPRASGLHN